MHDLPIYRRTNFTTFEHNNVDQGCHVNFRNRILNILPSTDEKTQKSLTKLAALVTSGRHRDTMITDSWKCTTNLGMSSFHFYSWNQFIKIPLGFTLCTKNLFPTVSATYDVRYWVNHVRRCSCLATDMEEKQTELQSENK